MNWLLLVLMILANLNLCIAQKVTVSREINIKGNYAYDVLSNVDGNIIFHHDRNSEQLFEIYDRNLRFIQTITPIYESSQFAPIGIVPMDTSFNFYYRHFHDGNIHYKVIAYNKNVSVVDSFTFAVIDKKDHISNPLFIQSEDKTKVLVFNPSDKGIYLRLLDNITFETYYEGLLEVPGINLKSDFRKIVLTNSGLLYLLTHKKAYWDKKENKNFQIIEVVSPKSIAIKSIFPDVDEISQITWQYDEKNKKLSIGGLTSYTDETKLTGYFGLSVDFNQLKIENKIQTNRFSSDFISETTGKKLGKFKGIPDLVLVDIQLKNDGGILLFTEMVREYVRRSQVMTPGQFGSFPSRGYMDYYHEDVLVFATHPDGSEHWQRILFKKQYSQDDEGAYSSFFLFKTPSRMKLIYNDEIRNNNTVSEYVLNPLGEYERKSVLSTEYQNLRIRFSEAEQIDSKTIIVPSEKSWKLNLVKIEYP